MFLHLSVYPWGGGIHSGDLHPGGGGVYRGFVSRVGKGGLHAGGLPTHPHPELEKRAVRILLECFLVWPFFPENGMKIKEIGPGKRPLPLTRL